MRMARLGFTSSFGDVHFDSVTVLDYLGVARSSLDLMARLRVVDLRRRPRRFLG